MEQDDYTAEEINWSYVEFVDNQDVLDLIEKVPSFWVDIFVFILIQQANLHITMHQICRNLEALLPFLMKLGMQTSSFQRNNYLWK